MYPLVRPFSHASHLPTFITTQLTSCDVSKSICVYTSLLVFPAQAEKTAALFLKDGETQGVSALTDMQHMWYELAAGAAHERRKEYGKVR